jgi:hypothetical protein
VDDAIVVVENIHRHQQMGGKSLREAIPAAVDEVGGPTILATFTVIEALLPMAFVTGSVLKGFANIEKTGSSRIFFNYYAGGYAKYTNVLLDFMNEFYKRTSVPTDFVYTGKLCYAIFDLLSQNYFPENSKILIVHSGGLQGDQSLSKGKLIF